MKKKFLAAILSVLCMVFSGLTSSAQQQQSGPGSPEEQEKKFNEYIQKEVDRLESVLNLEDWQVFYVDSLLTHDYHALQDETKSLSAAKVTNSDIYTRVADKWMENIYVAMNKVLDETQWAKYLKGGAMREKKAREKRKAKLESTAAKLTEND